MAAKTAWSPGNLNSGSVAFFSAFNAADLNGLANLSSVMSSVAAFDNTVAFDQFMDISFTGQIAASSTLAAGAGISFFLFTLQANGTTYGDGRMVAGTPIVSTTYTPFLNPLGGIPLSPGTAIVNIAGAVLNIAIPPRKFVLVLQNQTGFAFAVGGVCACSISTYCQNTNA